MIHCPRCGGVPSRLDGGGPPVGPSPVSHSCPCGDAWYGTGSSGGLTVRFDDPWASVFVDPSTGVPRSRRWGDGWLAGPEEGPEAALEVLAMAAVARVLGS